jgi:plastocyanin
MRKTAYLWMIAIILTIGIIYSCKSDNSSQPPPENTVLIKDNFFDPGSITITAGSTVVWRHQGINTHTVTSGAPTVNPGVLFDSGALNSGGGFQFTFSTPGSYNYFCRVHGVAMTGTVTVH